MKRHNSRLRYKSQQEEYVCEWVAHVHSLFSGIKLSAGALMVSPIFYVKMHLVKQPERLTRANVVDRVFKYVFYFHLWI